MNESREITEAFNDMKEYMKKQASLIILSAGIGAGKSTILMALYQYLKENNLFKNEIIISGSIFNNYYSKNGIKKYKQFGELSLEILKKIIKYQQDTKQKERLLLVIDDAICCSNPKDEEVIKMISILRHLNISVVIAIQAIKKLPPIFRSNCDFAFIGRTNGHANASIVYDELMPSIYKKNDFLMKFDEMTTNFKFVFINNRVQEKTKRVYSVKCDMKKHKIKD